MRRGWGLSNSHLRVVLPSYGAVVVVGCCCRDKAVFNFSLDLGLLDNHRRWPVRETYVGDLMALRHRLMVSAQRPWYTFNVYSQVCMVDMVAVSVDVSCCCCCCGDRCGWSTQYGEYGPGTICFFVGGSPVCFSCVCVVSSPCFCWWLPHHPTIFIS